MTPRAIEDPELTGWLEALGWPADAARPLAGDVSARRYFRLAGAGRKALLALYPAELREDCGRFERSGSLLGGAGVRVPRVYGTDPEGRWMLVEDLGDRTVYELGGARRELESDFQEAARIAARITTLPRGPVADLNPPLDAALLSHELDRTIAVYLAPRGLLPEDPPGGSLRAVLLELCDRLAAAPAAPAHRDFMVRNLVPLPAEGTLGVLDHQGLRLAPPFYDLASLLNDSLFPSPELEARLVAEHAPGPQGRLAYHRAAAQRALKAVGTYAAFAAGGNPHHLGLIPPTLGRALYHLAALPECRRLAATLARSWAPALPPA